MDMFIKLKSVCVCVWTRCLLYWVGKVGIWHWAFGSHTHDAIWCVHTAHVLFITTPLVSSSTLICLISTYVPISLLFLLSNPPIWNSPPRQKNSSIEYWYSHMYLIYAQNLTTSHNMVDIVLNRTSSHNSRILVSNKFICHSKSN